MLNVVIIDDEPKGREVLRLLLEENFPNVRVHAMASNVNEGVQAIKEHAPDLVFLDIEMPEANGFTLFQYFDKVDFEVVFTTAYDNYALRAIKVSALDYLLKPILMNDLRGAIDRAMNSSKIKLSDRVKLYEQERLSVKNEPVRQIALPTMSGFSIVKTDDVVYIQSDGGYSVFHLKDKSQIVVCKILKEFEELLSNSGFYRIHNSHIINLAYVQKYEKGKTGIVIMNGGAKLEVAARRKDDFIKVLRG